MGRVEDIAMCDCAKKQHKPELLEVGDEVCRYCSTMACGEILLPFWKHDGFEWIQSHGRPGGCAEESVKNGA